jgi:hypothetical protein
VRVEIELPARCKASEPCRIRVLLFNDSYEPQVVSRNALVGPNLRAVMAGGLPFPPSVEPTFGGADEPLTLQPFTFYGRERSFDALVPGEIEVTASYRREGEEELTASRILPVQAG